MSDSEQASQSPAQAFSWWLTTSRRILLKQAIAAARQHANDSELPDAQAMEIILRAAIAKLQEVPPGTSFF
jgi:hypothetical protein